MLLLLLCVTFVSGVVAVVVCVCSSLLLCVCRCWRSFVAAVGFVVADRAWLLSLLLCVVLVVAAIVVCLLLLLPVLFV